MNEALNSTAFWLATDGFGPGFVLAIQVGLIACVALLAARVVSRFYPGASHSIWLSAVMLSLTLFFTSALKIGWPVSISGKDADANVAMTPPEASESIEQERLRSLPEAFIDQTMDQTNRPNTDQAFAHRRPNSSPSPDSKESPSPMDLMDEATVEALAASYTSDPPQAAEAGFDLSVRLKQMVLFVYLGGFAILTLRLVRSALWLHWISRRGEALCARDAELAADFARHIGLQRTPNLLTSPKVTMPLVFGVIRPTVLLPSDFPSWTDAERRATLIHELTHVRRLDLVSHFLSLFNRCVYWFHPASWLFHRRLVESREWATDREVIDRPHHSLSPINYAESLLLVVSRLSRSDRDFSRGPALAMASHDDIETRLHFILKPARSTRVRRLIRQLSVGLVVLVALGTSVRLNVAPAEDAPTESPAPTLSDQESAESKAVKDKQNDSKETTRVELIELQAGDHNLLQRINRANPKPIPVSDPILTMDVSGTVLDADGQPVKDAVVLLRESSTTRISAASAFVETPEELYLRETADVLARTTSDASGKFEFHQIDAPGIPRRSADRSWAGDVVAAHPKYGICSIPIQSTASRRQNFNDLQATLTETTSLSGTYSTPEGEPVAGVVVTLDRLLTGSKSDRYTDGFDLQASQLNLRAITDSAGRFEFEQIPRSMLASLWVHDPDSAGAFVLAGTSPDVDSSKVDPSAVARYGPLAERPHAIVADPGVLVKGIIRDESGSPVADAMVVFGGMVLRHRSGADGSVSIRVASRTMDSYRRDSYRRRTNPSPSVPISIYTDQERGFMRTAHQLPVIGIDDGKPFEVTLQKGVRIEGVVVDQSGDPIEGIAVMNTSRETLGRGTSDEAGRYEMILPVGKHTLLFATDKFGFRLPNTREAYQRRDNLDDLLTLTIDIENDDPHKLPKTVIPEADTIQVIASLPDGKPAKGADAVVRDEKVLNADTRFPPQRVERSSNVLTNSIGRADLPVQGVLTEKAYVDLSLIDGDIAYYGSAMASEVVDGVLPIVLRQSPILEGRVSIDGKPYAGVVLSVGESQPISRSADGRRFNGFQTSNHQAVTTDADGFYRLPVKQDKRYSVSVSTLPGESTRPSVGYGAHAVGAGEISVREFQFRRGSGTIAGRVVDANGVGIAEADVRIQRERDTTPSFWIGHYDESTMTTNADGYFELKRVPEGTYQVRVSGKRPENRTQRAPSTMFAASTGQADLTVTLSDANAAAPLPRLTPVRIETVNPQR